MDREEIGGRSEGVKYRWGDRWIDGKERSFFLFLVVYEKSGILVRLITRYIGIFLGK